MVTFSPTAFRANSSSVFNAVQSNGLVMIESKSRPDMVLMLSDSHDVLIKTALDQCEKIRQLTALIKAQ